MSSHITAPASNASAYSARLALLNGASRNVEKDTFVRLLDAPMAEHPFHTLRLIAYIRDHHLGKGKTLLGHYALQRLAVTHPRELVHNLKVLVSDFGRFDDTAALMDSPVETQVLALLARQLVDDLAVLKESEHNAEQPRISMCPKWIPSQQEALERDSQMNKKLCRYMKISPATLRKVYLSPLRAKLQVLERFMCAKQWGAIDFEAVPRVAMQGYGKKGGALERNVGEPFTAWRQARAKDKKTKRAGWTLPPHDIVARYLKQCDSPEPDAYLEKQWEMAVDKVRRAGGLTDTVVLSKVLFCESDLAMRLSIMLALMTSTLSATDAFRNRVLVTEPDPMFNVVDGETLCARVRNLSRAKRWRGESITETLRFLLRTGVDAKLKKHEMPAKLLVVSDVRVRCVDTTLETNYDALKCVFTDAGYDMPRIVYWRVEGLVEETPQYTGQAEVRLIQGFSTSILRCVLAGKVVSPVQTLLEIVEDERYAAIALPSAHSARATAARSHDKL